MKPKSLSHIARQPNHPLSPKIAGSLRQGWMHTPFIDMRGQTYGTWLVKEYLHSEDQISLDTSWTYYYWSCACTKCQTEIVIERRRIRPVEKQQKCPTCKAAERKRLRAKAELKRLKDRLEARLRPRKPHKTRHDWSEIRKRSKAGQSTYAIAKALGCSQSSVVNALQKMGLKAPRNTKAAFLQLTQKYASESERRAANNERQRAQRIAARNQKIAEGTYKPRKYASDAERRAAINEKKRLEYRAERDRKIAAGTYRPRGRPRKDAI